MREAGIPKRYHEANWDDVSVREAADYVAGIQVNLRRGLGLMMAGPVGTGKSSIAALICREAIAQGFRVRWEYVPTMLDDTMSRDAQFVAQRRQKGPDLVVWDDFLVERLHDWQIGLLDRVVENRYASRKAMIVTSNIDPAMFKNDEALSRFVDRWKQTNKILHVDGQSRRRPE